MLQVLFLTILTMNKTAAVVILVVLLMRFLLRKAPKKWSYALWSVVGFRLVCPVSFQAVFSLFNLRSQSTVTVETTGTFQISGLTETFYAPANATVFNYSQNAGMPVSTPAADPMELWLNIGSVVWLLGIAALLIYSIISYVKLHRQMSTAIRLDGNVWQSDRVRSPFILGFVRPNIYIPFGLDADAQQYVLAHERCHLKHRDHWVKSFAFLLLAVHWFDPLVWLAFHLMGKDMEMRTDEEVLAGETNIRRAYSTSLLSFAANRRFPAPSPLAFGETGVKTRIKNVLNWKQPKVWVTVLAAVLCVAVVAACAADPKETTTEEPSCQVTVTNLEQGDVEPFVRWYEDGFDFDYDKLTPIDLPNQESYTLVFTPSWDCEVLEIGQDFYTRKGEGSTTYCDSFSLYKQADESFQFEIQRINLDAEEFGIYYIKNGSGRFVFKLNFEATEQEDQTDTWGVQLSASDVTAAGLTLTFFHSSGAPTGELGTGEEYWLEQLVDGRWTPVQMLTDEECWNTIGYEIPKSDSFTMEINWSNLYGTLADGTYRIGKWVHDWQAAGDLDKLAYYAEFSIGSDTPAGETEDQPNSVVTTRNDLDAAIHQAIWGHNKGPYTDQYFACESHVTLAHMTSDGLSSDNSDWVGQDIVYLMALYQEYEITADGIVDQSGSHMPIMLTFDRFSDGSRELVEYWTPKDGSYYESSIKENFPNFIWEDAMDTQKYILAQVQNCYAQAVAYAQLDTAPIIEALFDEIASSPASLSAPEDYMDAHFLAVRELTYYGDYTLGYIFQKFLAGGQEGLQGHLMRIVMDLLIGEEAIDVDAVTGQAYFDQWKAQVEMLSTAKSEVWMQENAPKGWLLLQMTEED